VFVEHAAPLGGRHQGEIEQVLGNARPLLVYVIGDVDDAARIDLPARQADVEYRAGRAGGLTGSIDENPLCWSG
jgi:hypothetical protein